MQPEPLVDREELTAVFFAIMDMAENTDRIRKLIQEEVDGEDPEDDS